MDPTAPLSLSLGPLGAPDAIPLDHQVETLVRSIASSSPSFPLVAQRTLMDEVITACVREGKTSLVDRSLDTMNDADPESHRALVRSAWRCAVMCGRVDLMQTLVVRMESHGAPLNDWERMAAIHSVVQHHQDHPVVTQTIALVGPGRPLDEACEMFSRSDDLTNLVHLLVAAPASEQERLLAQWPQAAEPARAILRHRQADQSPPVPLSGRSPRQRS